MRKYAPLSARLAGHAGPEWRATFAELEEVLGFPLPKSARAGKAWWGAGQARALAWEGWHIADLDSAAGRVTFRKAGAAAAPAGQREAQPSPAVPDEPAILKRLEVGPGWGVALAAGGAALVLGLGALALRAVTRRR